MDCIPYIEDLRTEIETLKQLKNDTNINEINEKINEKEDKINICLSNLHKLSNYKIEYRLYLYILEGMSATKAVEKVASENYQLDIKPYTPKSIWVTHYKKLKKILKNSKT